MLKYELSNRFAFILVLQLKTKGNLHTVKDIKTKHEIKCSQIHQLKNISSLSSVWLEYLLFGICHGDRWSHYHLDRHFILSNCEST